MKFHLYLLLLCFSACGAGYSKNLPEVLSERVLRKLLKGVPRDLVKELEKDEGCLIKNDDFWIVADEIIIEKLDLQNIKTSEAIARVELLTNQYLTGTGKSCGVRFIFDTSDGKYNPDLTFSVEKTSVKVLFETIIKLSKLKFEPVNGKIFISKKE
jgi:hypothetical protein